VHFLACAPYVTGQILAVDGGRSITCGEAPLRRGRALEVTLFRHPALEHRLQRRRAEGLPSGRPCRRRAGLASCAMAFAVRATMATARLTRSPRGGSRASPPKPSISGMSQSIRDQVEYALRVGVHRLRPFPPPRPGAHVDSSMPSATCWLMRCPRRAGCGPGGGGPGPLRGARRRRGGEFAGTGRPMRLTRHS